jgi:2,4-dienoyl-CoA reductase (NADPH2)
VRYFASELVDVGVEVRTGVRAGLEDLAAFDHVVLATGVMPRVPDVPGIDHPSVVTYQQVLRDHVPGGHRVAIMGAGGIGVDVAEYLTAPPSENPDDVADFYAQWGIDPSYSAPGGLVPPQPEAAARLVHLVQRRTTAVVCTGQEPQRELYAGLRAAGVPVDLVGGADITAELDAARAIRQATEVAAAL